MSLDEEFGASKSPLTAGEGALAAFPKEFKNLTLGTWGEGLGVQNVFQGMWVQWCCSGRSSGEEALPEEIGQTLLLIPSRTSC